MYSLKLVEVAANPTNKSASFGISILVGYWRSIDPLLRYHGCHGNKVGGGSTDKIKYDDDASSPPDPSFALHPLGDVDFLGYEIPSCLDISTFENRDDDTDSTTTRGSAVGQHFRRGSEQHVDVVAEAVGEVW